MLVTEEQKINYVFFLIEKDDQIPHWFYPLSIKLASFQIKLLPITYAEVLEMLQKVKRIYLIAPTLNQRSKKFIEYSLKSSLGLALRSGKIVLFHLSSFREISTFMLLKHKRYYNYFMLPLEMDKFCQDVAATYFHDQKNEEVWPGGRRGKLPQEKGGRL